MSYNSGHYAYSSKFPASQQTQQEGNGEQKISFSHTSSIQFGDELLFWIKDNIEK